MRIHSQTSFENAPISRDSLICRDGSAPDSLGSGIEEVDRILDGEVVAPVAQLDDAVEFADRGDCFRLLEVDGGDLQAARGSVSQSPGHSEESFMRSG